MVRNDDETTPRLMPKGRGHKEKTGKTSRVISIRLNSDYDAEKDALDVLSHFEAQGYTARQIITNALVQMGYDTPQQYDANSQLLVFMRGMMGQDSDFWRMLTQTVMKAVKQAQPEILRQYALSPEPDEDDLLDGLEGIPSDFLQNMQDMKSKQRFTREDE